MKEYQIVIRTNTLGVHTSVDLELEEASYIEVVKLIEMCVAGEANRFTMETVDGVMHFGKPILTNSIISIKEIK